MARNEGATGRGLPATASGMSGASYYLVEGVLDVLKRAGALVSSKQVQVPGRSLLVHLQEHAKCQDRFLHGLHEIGGQNSRAQIVLFVVLRLQACKKYPLARV